MRVFTPARQLFPSTVYYRLANDAQSWVEAGTTRPAPLSPSSSFIINPVRSRTVSCDVTWRLPCVYQLRKNYKVGKLFLCSQHKNKCPKAAEDPENIYSSKMFCISGSSRCFPKKKKKITGFSNSILVTWLGHPLISLSL